MAEEKERDRGKRNSAKEMRDRRLTPNQPMDRVACGSLTDTCRYR